VVKGVYNDGSEGRSITYNAYYDEGRLVTIEVAIDTPEAPILREYLNANGTPYQREYFINDTKYPQIRDDDFDNNGSLEHRIYDLNADGVPEAILQDLDGDGIYEIIDEDFDSDGLFVPLGPGLQFFHFG
jgi:hypothetical protein